MTTTTRRRPKARRVNVSRQARLEAIRLEEERESIAAIMAIVGRDGMINARRIA